MILRLMIDSCSGDKARVNIPTFFKIAIECGMDMPQISGNYALKNLDLQRVLEMVEKGVIRNIVEIESSDGDTVWIFVE